MSQSTAVQGTSARVASVSVFIGSFAVMFVAIGALLFVDLILARIDQRESDAHAASEYSAGLEALNAGRASDAGDHFSVALAVRRNNITYGLALATALIEEGRTSDAETTLRSLLDRAENDGAVNLTMAHAMVREQHWAEAKAYYHRAIFGNWGADSVERRTAARFELIGLLEKRGSSRELLAELLPFEETSPDSVDRRRWLAHLFVQAGSPARAATIFRDLIRRDRTDADAYAGLAESALALGNLSTARADLLEALRLQPNNPAVEARLAVADTAASLDPSARGVSSADRYTRSKTILVRTVTDLSGCLPARAAAASDSARAFIVANAAPADQDASSDAMLALASELWVLRTSPCPAVAKDEVLRLIQTRLTQ